MRTPIPTFVRATEVRYGDVIVVGGRKVDVLAEQSATESENLR